MTVMGSLTNIAKQRPVFYQRVVQAFEALHGEFITLVYINIAGDKNSTCLLVSHLSRRTSAILKYFCPLH